MNYRLLVIAILGVLSGSAAAALAQDLLVNDARQLSFQARLTNGNGEALDGNHTLEFNIYDDPVVPAALPGGGPFVVNVNIDPADNGVVAVLIPGGGVGLDASLFDGGARYLGLAIDGGVELTPRIQIAATPYAMRTNRVENEELTDHVELGDLTHDGSLMIYQNGANGPVAWLVAAAQGGELVLRDNTAFPTISGEGGSGVFKASGSYRLYNWLTELEQGRFEATPDGGRLETYDQIGQTTLEAGTGSFDQGGFVILRQNDESLGLQLDGHVAGQGGVIVGRTPAPAANKSYELLGSDGDGAGRFTMFDGAGGAGGPGAERIRLDANTGNGAMQQMWNNFAAETITIIAHDQQNAGLIAVANYQGLHTVGIHGDGDGDQSGLIRLRNSANQDRIILDASDASGKGRVRTDVLEITGGADLSEQFDINAGDADVQPGTVVAIDPQNPGKLIVSQNAYDKTVAGVISGAGGVNPGMVMGQTGSIANGKQPVALSGRVYCLVDASNGAIQPGDLLTTSGTPGHAMKVTDHGKAQGAIIGKAMTGLEKGKGLVLVLVTLQ